MALRRTAGRSRAQEQRLCQVRPRAFEPRHTFARRCSLPEALLSYCGCEFRTFYCSAEAAVPPPTTALLRPLLLRRVSRGNYNARMLPRGFNRPSGASAARAAGQDEIPWLQSCRENRQVSTMHPGLHRNPITVDNACFSRRGSTCSLLPIWSPARSRSRSAPAHQLSFPAREWRRSTPLAKDVSVRRRGGMVAARHHA